MTMDAKHALVRATSIGASEMSALLGLNRYKTAWDIWAAKTGKLPPDDDVDNDAATIGRLMERHLIDRAEESTGIKFRRNVIKRHKELPISCEHDGLAMGAKTGCEAKAVNDAGWGEPGTDQVPDYIQVQCQQQMMVSNLSRIVLPTLLFGFNRRFADYEVLPSKDLQDLIAETAIRFWEYNVKRDIPPDVAPTMEIARRVIRQVGKVVPFDSKAISHAIRYKKAARLEGLLKKVKEGEQAILAGVLKDAEAGSFELNGEQVLFQAAKVHRKGYEVKESDYVKFQIVKVKE
jgi:putative phage-type endonuclease